MTTPTLTTLLDEIDARANRYRLVHAWFDDGDVTRCSTCRMAVHKSFRGDGLNPHCPVSAESEVARLVAALRYALTHIATERDCVIANCDDTRAPKHRDALFAILSGQERAS